MAKSHNKCRDLLKQRLKELQLKAEGANCTEYGTARGDLRQGLLLHFLEELLPSDYSTRDGFVFDIVGHESPQLDVILWDKRRGPTIAFTSAHSYIPIESVCAVIEVKSTFQPEDEEQLDRQISNVMSMRPIRIGDGLWDFIVPFYVFAYDTTLSIARLRDCFTRFPSLSGIVVLGKQYLFQGKSGVVEMHDADFDGTLTFVSQLCRLLARQSAERPTSHLVWQWYLEGMEMSVPDE
jgi:hypothetical protein